MTRLVAKWTALPISSTRTPALTRSSNAVAILQTTAYFFGGEYKPRTPVDSDVITLNLNSGETRTLSANSTGGKSWPAARVGTSLVAHPGTNSLYLWGGRGGKEMSTFSQESEDLWRFDVAKEEWEMLKTEGERPEQRSFHVMTLSGDTLFLHAGCPSKGRLAALHSLQLTSTPLLWKSLPAAPGPGRGGTVLCSLSGSVVGSPALVRFGGFAGYELGGPLDVYDFAKGAWNDSLEGEELEVEGGGNGPEKRSVHALVKVEGGIKFGDKVVVALMTHGEREGAPAELGHDGAGFFHSDTWALLYSASNSKFSWLPLPAAEGPVPEARGWFASSFWEGNKIIVQGGLNERNERLGDGWVLEIVEA